MKYFNFPVKLMQGVLLGSKNIKAFLNDVLYYHIYNHYLKLTDIYEDGEIMEETDIERFKRSASFWGVTLGNAENSLERGEYLHRQKYKVYTGLNISLFWDYYKSDNKTDFQKECLFMHLAFKSILGKKEYSKTDNILLYGRMLGKETKEEYTRLKNGLKFTRWRRDKIITELETNWGLKYYSRNTRGFYFGYDIGLEKLILTAESKTESFKRETLKNKKEEILKSIKQKK